MSDGKVIIDTLLDTDGVEKGLKKLSGIASTGVKGTVKSIAAISTALAGVATAAVKVGSDFEEGMSRVKAIANASSEEMEALTEKAKEMGYKTKFSARESADAFYYMAQAGWKTQDMLDGIAGVMDLAAASGADLASTSDIVTDALTSFGLEASQAGHFADVLAEASADSNTDVLKMGETFKYVGSIAGAMKYSIEDMSLAIGLMANRGIKASQAGTSLRSIITRMANPTKDSATAMEALGLSITDSEGNMKSFRSIMEDMRKSMQGLTEDQKVAYAGMLAGKPGMSGLLAILNATDDEFNNLANSIDNCDGAADRMARTMQDNLKGQVEQLGGALESLGIEFYESVDNPLKDIVATATGMVEQLSKVFKKDGLSGMVAELGSMLADVATNMTIYLPRFIDIGVDVINNFLKGINENTSKISSAGIKILNSLSNGVLEILPKVAKLGANIMTELVRGILGDGAANNVKEVFNDIGDAISGLMNFIQSSVLPILKEVSKVALSVLNIVAKVAPEIITVVAAVKAFTLAQKAAMVVLKGFAIVKTIVSSFNALNAAIVGATAAQSALNVVMSANPFGLIAGAIAALVTVMIGYNAFTGETKSEHEKLIETINEENKAWQEVKASCEENLSSNLAEIDYTRTLYNELKTLVDENGNVTDANKARVDFIMGELNEALGTELTLTGNQIQNYKEQCKSIDELIEKKRAQIILESQEPAYKEAIIGLAEKENEQVELANKIRETQNAIERDRQKLKANGDTLDVATQKRLNEEIEKLDSLSKTYKDNESVLAEYYGAKDTYETNSANIAQGNYDKLIDIHGNSISSYRMTKDEIGNVTQEQVEDLEEKAGMMRNYYIQGVRGVTEEMVNTAENNARVAREKFESIGRNIPDGINAGKDQTKGNLFNGISGMAQEAVNVFSNNSSCYSVGENIATGAAAGVVNKRQVFIDSVREMANASVFEAKKALEIHSPSRKFRDQIGKFIPPGIAEGIDENSNIISESLNINLTDAYKKLRGVVDVETARTSANIVSSYNYTTYNNNVTTEGNSGTNKGKTVIETHVNIDGREIAIATAPYQDEWNDYWKGR